ncbi:hypothetical protein L7F22_042183 [Adiantum nelumboides]|nr:hypothetical protein [Adiantum nelumboides]
MGFGIGKDKKAKEPKSSTTKLKGPEKAPSKTNLTATEQGAKLASVKSESGSDTSPKQEGSNSPDSAANTAAGRRRRFNDTRELNLVASQLAAEALLPPSADHSRHTSMMGVLSQNGGHQYDGSTGTLPPTSSSSAAGLSMPQPAFASEARSTSHSASPVNGSPRTQASDLSRYEQPRAAFARSTHSTSSLPGSPSLTQSAKLSGLPSDMLTGLNDGPYPHLPPRSYDLSDPFGVPTMPSEFDIPSINLGGRNSLPNTSSPYRSRGLSSGSAGRRSVLQMSMYNPDQEMQGLTKKPKSGKTTPFGSRAPSRQPTPKSSKTNLREAAKEDAGKSSAPAALVASSQAIESSTPAKKPEASDSQDSLKPAVQKSSRMSMFGMKKNKSSTEVNKIVAVKENQLKPPSNINGTSTSNFGGSSERHSASNDSTTSRLQNGSISAQSLVKVPSPSMTTGSGSSHDRSAIGSASDGGNSYGNIFTSTATTPEVPISKADVFSSSQTQGVVGSPLVGALGDSLHQSSDQQPTPKPSTQNLSNGDTTPNVTSAPLPTSTPIYQALASSKDSKQEKMSNTSSTPQSTTRANSREAPITSASHATSNKAAATRPSLTKIKSNTGGGKSKVGKFISKFGASRDPKQSSVPASKSQTHLPIHQQSVPPLPVSANEKTNKYATVNDKVDAYKDNLNGEKGKAQTKFGQFRANLRNDWMA